jgi:hypothetical protein
MTKKLTAIDWFVKQLKINNYISENAHWLIDDAKELEKEQMKDALTSQVTTDKKFRKVFEKQFEEYYKETYEHK